MLVADCVNLNLLRGMGMVAAAVRGAVTVCVHVFVVCAFVVCVFVVRCDAAWAFQMT